MRLAVCLAIVLLAGCHKSPAADQPSAQGASFEPAPQPTSRAAPGTYSVTQVDGTKVTTVLASDHTYINTVHGKRAEMGAWAVVGGKTCFTPSRGADVPARCYSDGPLNRDGTFTSTPDQGDPITVKRIA